MRFFVFLFGKKKRLVFGIGLERLKHPQMLVVFF